MMRNVLRFIAISVALLVALSIGGLGYFVGVVALITVAYMLS